MRNIFYALVLFVFSTFSLPVFGQSSFETIRSVMQANCSSSSCHGGNALVFDVDGSATDLYNSLVGVVPGNAVAAAKGNKLVDPGHPYNSFLLRKVGSDGFDAYIQIADNEKSGHPVVSLQNYEIELIRQWIMAGAPENGTPVDYQLLQDYYTNGGLPFIPVPDAPAASQGTQRRMGPIFLAPQAEFEYMKKENLHNATPIKVAQMNGHMSSDSHHMLLFKNDGNGASAGLRRVPFQATPFDGGSILTGAWQDDGDFELPQGTAFYWASNTTLDFDYHIKNYSETQILPADFYLDIMYSEETNPIEMHAALENNIALILVQGDNTRVSEHIPGGGGTRYIYTIASHTHKYGKDYDIFIRNSDGSRGEQIYEGFYNNDYTFNQGYYDWNHPANRYFKNGLKAFKESDGLIYEVKWNVAEPLVTFGLTTDGEMMLFTYMYTTEKVDVINGVNDIDASTEMLDVYPNPFESTTTVNYTVEKAGNVQVDVYDMVGKRVATALDADVAPGNHTVNVDGNMIGNKAGVYFVTVTVDGVKMSTGKVTKL